jgi:hypothetical protein
MDIATLKTLVRAGLSGPAYNLDIASLNSAAITALAGGYLAKDHLALSPAETPFTETTASITVHGAGIDRPFVGMTIAATFDLDEDGDARLELVATGDASWRFAKAFAQFEGNLGADLPFTGSPRMTLTSAKPVIAFAGTLDFGSLSGGLKVLLGLTTEDLAGDIAMAKNGTELTSFALEGPALTGIDLFIASDITVDFGMGAHSLSIPGRDPALLPYVKLGAAIPFHASGREYNLPLSVQATSLTAPIRFDADLTGVIDATLNELGTLVGGANLASTLPPPHTMDPGETLALTDLYLDVMPDGSAVSAIGLTVQSKASWDVVTIQSTGRVLKAQDLFLAFAVANPFSKPFPSLIFGGTFAITPHANLKLTAFYPNFAVSGYLADNSKLVLRELVEEFVGPTQGLPDLAVDQLTVSAASANYQFSVDVVGFWAINTGVSLGLIVNQLGFEISYTGGNVEAHLSGTFTIASVDLTVRADYQTTDAWTFSGKTGEGQAIPIKDFVDYAANTFSAGKPPDWVHNTTLKDITTSFNTRSKNFAFTVTGDIPLGANTLEITLGFAMTAITGGYRKDLTGTVDVAGNVFVVDFIAAPSDTAISASWSARTSDDYLEFATIAGAFAPKADIPELPEGLKLSIKDIALTYDFDHKSLTLTMASANYGNAVFVAYHDETANKWVFYFGVAIDKPLDLSNLPVLDHVLSRDEKIEVRDMQALIASSPFDPSVPAQKAEIEVINGKIPDKYPRLPDQGLPGQVAISAVFNFGGDTYPLSIGTPAAADAVASPSVGRAGAAGGPNAATVPAPQAAADGTSWFNIQKSFGPVTFQKVGVRYQESVLWFVIDASMTAAGLGIAVEGLAVGSPLSSFQPQFHIDGLGVDYAGSAFTVGGSFVNFPPVAPIAREFGGMLAVQAEGFGAVAMGGYAEFSGQTSMFVFASIDALIGGPPYFLVNGLCGGFGYNNALRIPAQDEVFQFPFVAALSDPAVFGPDPTPLSVLQHVMAGSNPWVTPSAGDFWLGLGIRFSTFEVINSTALLIGEFGNRFEVALIGLSKGRFPMAGPDIYAYFELQLEAVFDPTDGIFSVSVVLSPNSYLLDTNCKLTGGAAFEVWYHPSRHAGDFVVTAGGYSPYFTVPDHYPRENRIGFRWSIGDSVTLSGGLYFAITPAALMAGGQLGVTYQSGNLKAWFDAHADIIAWYNPFHFIADIGVTVGASYKTDLLFCSKTFSVELGADLTLWGPPTGGTVTVHWFIVSFTVAFGSPSGGGTLDNQDWSTFAQVLPPPGNVVSITAAAGMQAAAPVASQARARAAGQASAPPEQPWLVHADAFTFTADCKIPLTKLFVGDDTTPFASGSQINIKPMQTQGSSFTHLTVIDQASQKNVLDKTWAVEARSGDVPVALWGAGKNGVLPLGSGLVPDQLTGLLIKVPPAKLGPGTGAIDINKDLQYDPLPPGTNPLRAGLPPVGPVPRISTSAVADIGKIMDQAVLDARNALHATFAELALPEVANGSLAEMQKRAGALFVDEPLEIGTLT